MLTVITGRDVQTKKQCINHPDACMHPSDFLEYARKLVLLSKSYNISIITYAPALIEAIDVQACYYNMEYDIEYILNNNKILPNELFKIYNHLAEIYNNIDKIRLQIRWRDNQS